jgi:2-polyprenyl-3-methyl-5-hydroxy-6-metoxy-1,4-benzoquinol methylase
MADGAEAGDAHFEAKRSGYYRSVRRPFADFLAAHHRMGGRALEVGCGDGLFGAELLRRGFTEVVGIEPVPEAADRARANLSSVAVGTFQGVDRNAFGRFDVVAFGDSLEHMLDPWQALRDAREMLTDDGVLLLSVPNVSHWSVLWPAWKLGRWEYKSEGLLDRTHLRFFTPSSLEAALVAAGFETTGSMGTEPPLPPGRRWLKPVIARLWPHLLVYHMYVVAARAERIVDSK